jgi:hypothetical protein
MNKSLDLDYMAFIIATTNPLDFSVYIVNQDGEYVPAETKEVGEGFMTKSVLESNKDRLLELLQDTRSSHKIMTPDTLPVLPGQSPPRGAPGIMGPPGSPGPLGDRYCFACGEMRTKEILTVIRSENAAGKYLYEVTVPHSVYENGTFTPDMSECGHPTTSDCPCRIDENGEMYIDGRIRSGAEREIHLFNNSFDNLVHLEAVLEWTRGGKKGSFRTVFTQKSRAKSARK